MLFYSILNKNPDKISPYDLIEIANIINNGFYPKGFRKTQVNVRKANNFFPIAAKNVPNAIYSLFNAYNNIWNDLDVYEKEAKFHIELIRIQPFEDGNKRTARILTNFNLCKNNKAPIVINKEQTEQYFKYIDEYDVDKMTELFKQNSKQEFNVMLNLYQNICGDSIEQDVEEAKTDNDVKLYKFIKDKRRKFGD